MTFHSCLKPGGSDNNHMGLKEAEPMTQLIDAAQRLRLVRAAHRRFLTIWALGRDENQARPKKRPRLARENPSRSSLRQLWLSDDLS